jgi:hypothetical protein
MLKVALAVCRVESAPGPGSPLVKVQADPEEDEGPQQNCAHRRRDGFQRVEMNEVVVRRGHYDAHDDVDDQEDLVRCPLPLCKVTLWIRVQWSIAVNW